MTRATLRDVAAQAGVSHQTVSNVLNDHPSIRPTTRAKVMTAIQALDYHPNVAAKALRESRVTTLCIAFYGHSSEDISDPYRNLIQSAFIAETIKAGYSVTTAFLDEAHPETFQRLRQAYLGQQFGGIVMVGTTMSAERLREFERWNMPTVLFDRTDPGGLIPSVTADYVGGMAKMVEYHVSRGRRRLALVLPLSDLSSSAALRRKGFLSAVEQAGVSGQMMNGDWSSESGEAGFAQLWNQKERPDAVLGGNDRMAAGVLLGARARGLSLPGDLAVSGFDDLEFARYTGPSLTTIHVPYGDMARRTVRMLLGRLERTADDFPELNSLELPVSLVVRESA